MTRTRFITTSLAAGMSALIASAAGAAPAMQVFKTATCGCCAAWVEHMEEHGFDVTVTNLAMADLMALKKKADVAPEHTSCHTARVGEYIVEGHVPAPDVKRLLSQGPAAIVLAVPGMPYGSPGMGGPGPDAEPYDVLLVKQSGAGGTFARYR